VGKGSDSPLRGQACQRRGRLARPPEDDEGDGGGERHQGRCRLAVGGAYELDGLGPEAGLGKPGSDHQVDQRRGAAQAGASGAEHPGVAGLHELGGEVDGDVRAGLVVGADDADRHAPFLQLEPVVELPAPDDALQRGQRRQGTHLPGDAGEADLVEAEPVEAARRQRRRGTLHVLLVGAQECRGLGGEAAGDAAEGVVDLVVGRPGHVGGGPPGFVRRLPDQAEDLVRHGEATSWLSWLCAVSGRIQRLSARLEPSEALVPSTFSVSVPSGPMPVTSTVAPGISFFSSK